MTLHLLNSFTISSILFAAIYAGSTNQYTPATHILFIGDSLTAGYGVPPEKSYPSLVSERFKQLGLSVKVTNSSVSGSTSASGPGRVKWALKAKPNIIVLALGANDGLRGLSTQNLQVNLEKSIKILSEGKVITVLAGIQVPNNYGSEYQESFNSVFKNLKSKYSHIHLIPFLLEGVAKKPNLNLPDGIHPNEQGYEVIASEMFKHLLPLVKKVSHK